ncbi:hypothetical protein [Kocuria turfanensis]|uniref:Uncharacterized protein n=1 Tax=Kocuria turfanensis TaxID=388357 RepID=A0A512IEB1_9MICC|nr:hypothetical protein [Kocuria turfanensis]GEO96036.1 hypothetical protein KTU01_21590 [Kocuria turfanensis]
MSPDAGTASPTGHARVDAVLERAAELDALPVAEHPGRYEELHADLVAELNAEPGTVPAGLVPGREAGQEQNGSR